jgi:hydrogenase maturation protease
VRDPLPGPDGRARLIGTGHALRGDDAAGLLVARRLGGITHEGEGTALLDLWEGCDAVVLVDTVRSGVPPGTIRRFDASTEPLPAESRFASTHAIGVAEAIELARSLGRLPRTVIVYGVEGAGFAAGAALSAAVRASLEALTEAVREELVGYRWTSSSR